jgi:hypothetical protein
MRSTLSKTKPAVAPVPAGPRAGDVVEDGGGHWLLVPDVLGGLRRELLHPDRYPFGGKSTTGGLQCDSALGRRFLVTDLGEADQAVWTLSTWMHASPPVSYSDRAARWLRTEPWWSALVPRTRETAPLLEAAGPLTPPPWAAELRADATFMGLREGIDEMQVALAAGIGDSVRRKQVKDELVAARKMIDGRLARARAAWVEANASGVTVAEIAGRQRMFEAAWWSCRDGSVGEVELFARKARSIDVEAAGWRDPAAELPVLLAWFDEHDVEVPELPDISAKPRSLDEILVARATEVAL